MIDLKRIDGGDRNQPFYQKVMAVGSFWVILGVLLVALWGCSVSPTVSPTTDMTQKVSMSEMTLTQVDNGRTIDIRVGDRLDVNLRENPTTGFQWVIDQNNDEVLRVEGAEYISPTTSPIGGAGQRTFTFIGQQSGTAELRLKLWREWQGESSVVERFTVTIQVHD